MLSLDLYEVIHFIGFFQINLNEVVHFLTVRAIVLFIEKLFFRYWIYKLDLSWISLMTLELEDQPLDE